MTPQTSQVEQDEKRIDFTNFKGEIPSQVALIEASDSEILILFLVGSSDRNFDYSAQVRVMMSIQRAMQLHELLGKTIQDIRTQLMKARPTQGFVLPSLDDAK